MARKKWIPPISVNVNMANRNLHMYGHLKLQTEFCLFGGARGPPWAPRLFDMISGVDYDWFWSGLSNFENFDLKWDLTPQPLD